MNSIKFPFNKVFPLILTLLLSIYIEFNIKTLIKIFFPTNLYLINLGWVVNIIAGGLIILIVLKFLLPLLNAITAIKLDNNGLTDNVRNVRILWKDIKAIDIETGKSSSNIIITLADYNTHTIYLSFISGKDRDIYKKIKEYFEHVD